MIAHVLASILVGTNSVTFTARATGVDVGTPIEFFLAGSDSDRDYETMFLLDDSISNIVKAVEKSHMPIGRPIDVRNCYLWPMGSAVELQPPVTRYIESRPTDAVPSYPPYVLTGGERSSNGVFSADAEMPKAFFALYNCPQSVLQFNGSFPQELVYGCHVCTNRLVKGTPISFKLLWSGTPMPQTKRVTLSAGQSTDVLKEIKDVSASAELDVLVEFADNVTIAEATTFAAALSVIDSPAVKINGRPRNGLFYRSFLPLVKWTDRQQRLTQPFEIRVAASGDFTVTFIEEDWSGEGSDPKLTPKTISIRDMTKHPLTNTVFFFAPKSLQVGQLKKILQQLPDQIMTHYVFGE